MQEVAWQVLAPAAVHISAAELKRLVQTRPSRHKSASPCAGQSRSENRRTPASCERRWYGTTVAVPWTLARTPRSCRSAPTQRLCTSPCGWTRWFLNPAMSFDDGAKLFSTRFRTVRYASRGLTMDASFTTPHSALVAFSHQSGSVTLRAMSWRPRQPLCPLSTLTTRPCAARTIPNISIDTTRARRRLLACTGVGATEYPLPPRQACASSSRGETRTTRGAAPAHDGARTPA